LLDYYIISERGRQAIITNDLINIFACLYENEASDSGAPPTEVGGTNAPSSAKPAEVPFPHLSANRNWRLSAKAGKTECRKMIDFTKKYGIYK
jgi:hypothetical protein